MGRRFWRNGMIVPRQSRSKSSRSRYRICGRNLNRWMRRADRTIGKKWLRFQTFVYQNRMGEVMRTSQILARCVAVMLIAAGGLRAEEKPKPESEAIIPVKVTLVFNEYDGDKKLSSLPYTMPVNAQAGP